MKKFFDYNENITEIKNENLRNIGFNPEFLEMLFLFAFNKELDNDLFEYETISDNASMLNVWPIYLYWVERDEELFHENFGDMCEFFDALVEEFRRNITSDNIHVDWQLDIDEEDVYVIFSEKNKYDDMLKEADEQYDDWLKQQMIKTN
jgi:hypothetical protein